MRYVVGNVRRFGREVLHKYLLRYYIHNVIWMARQRWIIEVQLRLNVAMTGLPFKGSGVVKLCWKGQCLQKFVCKGSDRTTCAHELAKAALGYVHVTYLFPGEFVTM